jgi:hypothetical protein
LILINKKELTAIAPPQLPQNTYFCFFVNSLDKSAGKSVKHGKIVNWLGRKISFLRSVLTGAKRAIAKAS